MLRAHRILLALALALAGASCTEAPEQRPNVLLITLDTVRPDRMGFFGAERDTTPHLDAFARESAVFENAFANSSFTPPSHASILTSRYPTEHGLLHWNKSLGDVPTAADLFAAAGYRTGAFTPFHALVKIGLQRGFQEVRVPDPIVTYTEGEDGRERIDTYLLAPGEEVNEVALPWLFDAEAEAPFFAWVHYYDAHRPYGAHGWKSRYNEDFEHPEIGDTEEYYRLDEKKRERLALSPEEVAYIEDRYDGGLARLDAQVGALLGALRDAGSFDDTIIAVIADHGEVFAEYTVDEWFSHDPWLADENLHVPFFLRLPDGKYAGVRTDALVEGVDVLPTLLELADVPAGDARFSGRSLVGVLEGDDPGKTFVFAERQGNDLESREGASEEQIARSRDRRRMVRSDEWKLVDFVDRGHMELWDLDAETIPVSDERAPDAEDLARGYANRLKLLKRVSSGSSSLDEELDEALGALGYTEDEQE